MDRFVNALKAYATALDGTLAQPRFGIIASVDPALPTARVQLQPEGTLSGWLPVLSPWAGAGWGMFCPPSPGDQVLVLFQEGASEHGVIIGSSYSGRNAPPGASAGEVCLAHSTGTTLKLANDGTVHITGPVVVEGTLAVSGDLNVKGSVSDSGGSLSRLRAHYDSHTHIDSRGGTTSPPTPQD